MVLLELGSGTAIDDRLPPFATDIQRLMISLNILEATYNALDSGFRELAHVVIVLGVMSASFSKLCDIVA